MPIELTIIHDDATFYNMQTEWEHLQEQSVADSLFITWEWMSLWWQTFANEPHDKLWIILAHENDTLIGIAPMMRAFHDEARGLGWRQIQFIGADAPVDHWDFLVVRGREAEIVPLFLQHIKSQNGEWDVLELANILPDSPTIPTIQASNIPWEETDGHITPFINIEGDFDSHFSSLSSNKRQQQRRHVRKMEKEFGDNWSFEIVMEPEQVKSIMAEMIQHHQSKWEALGEPGAFPDNKLKNFYTELAIRMAKRGWLRLFHLKLGDETAEIVMGFGYRGRVSYFASGMNFDLDQWRPGHITHEQIIRHLFEADDVTEYDFMWGDERYKFSWGAQERIDRTFTWYASMRGKMIRNAIELARRGKQKLKAMTARKEETEDE